MEWYISSHQFTRDEFDVWERDALNNALPALEEWMTIQEGQEGLGRYVDVPILTKESWEAFESRLNTFDGSSSGMTHCSVVAKL
jgi:hypothetical protein